jgi:hypothetical protein
VTLSASSEDRDYESDEGDDPYKDLDFRNGRKITEDENQKEDSNEGPGNNFKKRNRKERDWHKVLRAHMIETMNEPFVKLYNACNGNTIPVDDYEKLRDELPKSKMEFMSEIGWNFDSRTDYQRFDLFLKEGRSHLVDVITAVLGSPDYQRWWDTLERAGRNQIQIEDEIFATCMVEAMRQGYCPFYSDRNDDNKLKPLIVDDYREQLRMYQRRSQSEMKNRVNLFKAMSNAFPSLPNTVSRVPIKTDGLFEIEDKKDKENDNASTSEDSANSTKEESGNDSKT